MFLPVFLGVSTYFFQFLGQINGKHFLAGSNPRVITPARVRGNTHHIKEYQRHDGGYVVMGNGVKLEVSQRKRKDFLAAIEDITL